VGWRGEGVDCVKCEEIKIFINDFCF